MMKKEGKINIYAVHESDANTFWKKLELDKIESCFVCGVPVTSESFGAIGVCKKKVVVCCYKASCFCDFRPKIREEEKK